MLFHLSEEANIDRLEPRVPASGGEPLVWAIDAEHVRNYLVPRACPRVTFYDGPHTSRADRARFLTTGGAVLAIESAWYERLRHCRLYRYHLPSATFECIDAGAGYYVSREPVAPVHVEIIDDPLGELLRQGIEIRLLPSLWELHDAVASSSLQFSMIRMRNAAPPTARSF